MASARGDERRHEPRRDAGRAPAGATDEAVTPRPERIDVATRASGDGWDCVVTVGERGDETRHVVHVSARDLARLDPGADDPTGLVHASFGFLLAREPKESILRSFDLPVIGRYFPEYEGEIRRRPAG
jgi:hypothetical protein